MIYSDGLIIKKISKIALAALAILFVMAAFFFKERVFFGDASYILFNIINSKSLYIQEHRYGSFITQIIPYLGVKMHLPIKVVTFCYAISFNLFYLCAGYVLFRLRQYALVLLMGFYYLLLVSDSYFWINNEIHQAIAWMFLLIGTTLYLGGRKTNIFFTISLFTLLAFLTVFTHFVVIIPTVFLWVYLILEKKNWPFSTYTTILLSGILSIILITKYAMTVTRVNSYDHVHLEGLRAFSLTDIIPSFGTPVVRVFIYRCITNYWLAVIILGMSLGILLKQKKWLLASWTSLSVLGYIILMGVIYGDLDKNIHLFHIESEWASIGILCATSFVCSLTSSFRPLIAFAAVTCIFLIRFVYIFVAAQPFELKYVANQQLAEQMKKRKITNMALINNQRIININMLYWAVSYESLLESAYRGDKPQTTFFIISADDEKVKNEIIRDKGFYNSYGMMPIKDLNSDYFTIDTIHHYQVMSYDELMR